MKQIISLSIMLFITSLSNAQVGINSNNNLPATDAMLDVSSTTKGLLIPRMTVAERDQLSATSNGLMVYLTDLNLFSFYNGTEWNNIAESVTTDKLIDADNDTSVELIEHPNKDLIRFSNDGTESINFKLTNSAPYHLLIQPTSTNTLIGYEAANNLKGTASNNVIIGALAGQQVDGNDVASNVYVGYGAGYDNNQGSQNIMIGSLAGAFSSTSNSIFLGKNVGNNINEDYRLEIRYRPEPDNGVDPSFIYGEFDNRWLKFDAGLALGTENSGSTGNRESQLLISGKEDEGVNNGSSTGTHKVKIEGYQNDGNKVYPISIVDEDGNMDFYIENKNSSNVKPEMYFDGTMSVGGYNNANDNHLVLQTAGGNSWKTGLKMTHWSNQFGFTIESDDAIELDGADQSLLFKVHNYDVDGTIIGAANGDGNWAFGGTEIADGYTISVNGKLACEEVMVDLKSDWPDYVFEEEYNLNSIKEVENFIKSNGHLPGVPSASEVANKGLLLGDMNKIMMEKIEELTLYIIQQQTTIEKQQDQIDQLKELVIRNE